MKKIIMSLLLMTSLNTHAGILTSDQFLNFSIEILASIDEKLVLEKASNTLNLMVELAVLQEETKVNLEDNEHLTIRKITFFTHEGKKETCMLWVKLTKEMDGASYRLSKCSNNFEDHKDYIKLDSSIDIKELLNFKR